MGKENNTQEEENKSNTGASTQEVAKINAIRDIIFGTDMAEYNQQFESVKQIINNNKQNTDNDKQELLDRIQSLEDNINQKLQTLEEKITARLDKLQHEKTDREVLGNLLEEIGKKIKQ